MTAPRAALASAVAMVVVACSPAADPASPTIGATGSPTPPPERTCALVIEPDVRGPGATFRGTGFAVDVPVVLAIDPPSGPVLTEDQITELHTDARGDFVLRLRADRVDIGTLAIEAAAGGCTATAIATVTAAMFPPRCTVEPPVASGGPAADAYAAAVAADEPLAWWRFEEDAGTVAGAMAGDDGTYAGLPALAQPGVVAGSRSIGLDGVDDWVDVPDVSLAGDFTIEAWLWLCGNTIDNADAPVGQGGEGPDVNLFEERLRLYDGSGDPAVARVPIEWGRWVHVAVTRTTGRLTLWLDGADVGSGDHEPAFPITALGWGNAGLLEGRLDEVALYEHALAAARLEAHVGATR